MRRDTVLRPVASQRRRWAGGPSLRLLGARGLNYATNRLVANLPSHHARRWWYRQLLGVPIGAGSSLHLGCYLWFYGPGQLRRRGLSIGKSTLVNRDCCLDARARLSIGSNVSISPGVMILTTQHRIDDPEFGLEGRPVVIEDHVFIGSRALVMPGVTVGRGAVVAAGAVVTKDVAPLSVVGGNPARPIAERRIVPDYTLTETMPLFE